MSENLDLRERLRRIYRALEMSAEIMRDPQRTGGGSGARRTADAFQRQAEAAKQAHFELCTEWSRTPAADRAEHEGGTHGPA